MVEAAFRVAKSSPMFRAIFGVDPSTEVCASPTGRRSSGRDAHFDLPKPGAVVASLPQRIAVALVRMIVFGSVMALAGRNGVLLLDEARVHKPGGASCARVPVKLKPTRRPAALTQPRCRNARLMEKRCTGCDGKGYIEVPWLRTSSSRAWRT